MYTQLPNDFIDKIMPAITPAATLCYMIIARHTFGWHRESDAIPISQFVGQSGLTKPTVTKALRELSDAKIIAVTVVNVHGRHTQSYSITGDFVPISKESLPREGKNLSLSGKKSLPREGKNLSLSGQIILPLEGKILSPQKKGKESNKEKEKKGSARDARLDDWQFTVYRELAHLHVPHAFRDDVSALTDESLWRTVIKDWIGRGWRPTNIAGMLDMYSKGVPSNGRPVRQNDGRGGNSSNGLTPEEYVAANQRWLSE